MNDGSQISRPKCGYVQNESQSCQCCELVFAKIDYSRPPVQPAVPKKQKTKAPFWGVALILLFFSGMVVFGFLALRYFSPQQTDGEKQFAKKVFLSYRQAVKISNIEEIKRHLVPERRADFEGENARNLLELAKSLIPGEFTFISIVIHEGKATIELQGEIQGQKAKGRAELSRINGEWLLAKEEWNISLDLPQAAEAEANPFAVPGESITYQVPLKQVEVSHLTGGKSVSPLLLRGKDWLVNLPSFGPGAAVLSPTKTWKHMTDLAGHKDGVENLVFSPDGKYLISSSWGDMSLRLWLITTGEMVAVRPTEWRVAKLAMSPNGRVAYTVDAYLHVLAWPIESHSIGTPTELGRVEEHENNGFALSPNGKLLATCGGLPNQGGHLTLWDAQRFIPLDRLESKEMIFAVAFSADNRFLAVAGHRNSVWVYDLREGEAKWYEIVGPASESECYGVSFCPTKRLLATVHNDSSMSILDLAEGKQLHDFFVRDASAMAVAFSPDGSQIATAQAGRAVFVWNADSGERLIELQVPGNDPLSVAYSPQGTILAAGSRSGIISLWK